MVGLSRSYGGSDVSEVSAVPAARCALVVDDLQAVSSGTAKVAVLIALKRRKNPCPEAGVSLAGAGYSVMSFDALAVMP